MEGLGRLCQVGLASCPASEVVSSSFPPAPFGSCISSLPVGGNTPPGRDATQGKVLLDTPQQCTSCFDHRTTYSILHVFIISYPAVGRLVHVPLDFSSVGHQVLHPPVLQCGWIRRGEDGLHTALTHGPKARRATIKLRREPLNSLPAYREEF